MHRGLFLSFSESTFTYLSKYTSTSKDFVTLQSLIMNSSMKNERKLFIKEHEGEQCNSFRSCRWYNHGFEFSLRIPHSCNGNFYPVLLYSIRRESKDRAKLFNLLYIKGLNICLCHHYIYKKRESN